MAGVRRFEDLAAWQRCMELAREIFEMTESGRASRDLEFTGQIRDAADAAAPLIAEGFARFTPREFARYLGMARAELAEVQTHLAKVRGRGYFTDDQHARAEELARRAAGITTNLLKSKLRQIAEEASRKRRRHRAHRGAGAP